MQRLIRFYSFVNILSLDIAAGAVVSALFFSKILSVHILPYGLAALALTVWIIYTTDHLRDAMVIENTASSERHRFHQKYFRQLLVFLLIAIALDLVLILYARKPVFRWGVNLGSIVFIYLVVQRYLKILKETLIAILYTIGVLLPSLSVSEVTLSFEHYCLFIEFALVALMNLFIFSWYDYETDLADHQRSFATTAGRDTTRIFIYLIAIAVLALWTYLVFSNFYPAAATIVLSMAILHLTIFRLAKTPLSFGTHYRILADAIFVVPLIYLPWAMR
jgi:hypothetical protein